MAQVHGNKRAGQYAKSKALTQTYQVMTICMSAMAVFCTLLGALMGVHFVANFAWARRWADLPGWVLLLFELAVYGACLYSIRFLDRPINDRARERLKWLRGGQAEGFAAWLFNDMEDEWHVFHNLQLERDSDIDHVLVGPRGIYCISTKATRGMYSVGPGGAYLLNGEETDHVHAAQRTAMRLKDRLSGVLGEIPWIQPVLLAPLAFVAFPTKQHLAWVVHEDNVPEVFDRESKKLKTAEVDRIVRALEMIASGARHLYERPTDRPDSASSWDRVA